MPTPGRPTPKAWESSPDSTAPVGCQNVGDDTVRKANALEAVGSGLVYAHHTVIAAVGVFGFVEAPSPTVVLVIGGEVAASLWSGMFVIFGLLALGCRFANRIGFWPWAPPGDRRRLDTTRSEAICIVLIGVAMFLFGGIIAWSTAVTHTPGSWQTALVLLAGAVFLPGVAALSLAMTRRARIQGVAHTADVLDRVAREIGRDQDGG